MLLGITFTDGDFTTLQPHGPPRPSFPLTGDSIFSKRDIVFLNDSGLYTKVAFGNSPNIQLWSAQQACLMIEQDFMVLQSAYQPLRLNSGYNPAWSLGWQGVFGDVGATPIPDLSTCMLVSCSTLEDMGGGISKMTMRFVSLPASRNEMEQFAYTFPGLDYGDGDGRSPFTDVVPSRIQCDYYLFDDWNVTSFDLFPDGPKLNATTGIYPPGLILPSQKYYSATEFAVGKVSYLTPDGRLSNANSSITPPALATTPSLNDYLGFVATGADLNGAELIAEASTFSRWMGNIYERRTRFVLAT